MMEGECTEVHSLHLFDLSDGIWRFPNDGVAILIERGLRHAIELSPDLANHAQRNSSSYRVN
jgi:hypothetical protein